MVGSTATIVTALEDAAALAGERGFVYHLEHGSQSSSYAEMLEQARTGASALARLGIEPGDRVGILGPNLPEWVRSALSIWVRGATVVPIPFGMRILDLEDYVARIRSLVDAAGCRLVLADPRFVPALTDISVSWDTLETSNGESAVLPPTPSDIAVLQLTSGTTSAPKVAVISHGAVMACCSSFLKAWNLREHDVSLTWLPLFHDNGLFGHIAGSIVGRVDNHIVPTERFARRPALWFQVATEVGATMTSGPGSAWAVALKAALRNPSGIDLSMLRMGIVSAEAIDPSLLDRYAASAEVLGLRPGTICGAYGLAEATLVVTTARPGEGARIDRIDSHELAEKGHAVPAITDGERTRRVVSCGRPIPGVGVRIMDAARPLQERQVGEIQVSGPTLMRGYAGREASEQPFTDDGWLSTGDLGYLSDGELFFTGRAKDLVIVLGRNYAPEEFEWVAEKVPGVKAGRSVAFNAVGEGEGGVVIVFEVAPGAEPGETAVAVRRAISRSLGVALESAVPAAKGTILKTTSGKLRRAAVRDAYGRGDVVPAAPRDVPADEQTGV